MGVVDGYVIWFLMTKKLALGDDVFIAVDMPVEMLGHNHQANRNMW